MDFSLLLNNLLSPAILFFMLGMLATLVKSDLAIPPAAGKFLSMYLLFSIGYVGGVELRATGWSGQMLGTLAAGVVMSCLVPVWSFAILRRWLEPANAAAAAACYGSVSAVTFLTAANFLETKGVPFSGHMVAAMAIMESPAIVTAVLLYRSSLRTPSLAPALAPSPAQPHAPSAHDTQHSPGGWKSMAHEALFNGAVFLLLGSLAIGMITGEAGFKALKPVVKDPFKGLLCFFLLDMGMIAAKRLGDLRAAGLGVWSFSLIAPLLHASLGIAIAFMLKLSPGDALLFAVLCGSASYIAVPAAMPLCIPQANPSVYVAMSLAMTFPLNITLGIPLYLAIIERLWSLRPPG